MPSSTDWKTRYETSVRMQGQRESSWQETELMLRRAIRRLAIAGRGRDTELDSILTEVQRLVQSKRDRELDQAMDLLARRVIQISTVGDAKKTSATTSLLSATILDLVKLLHIDDAQKRWLLQQADENGKVEDAGLKRIAEKINAGLSSTAPSAAEISATSEQPDGNRQAAGDDAESESIESVMLALVSRLSLLQGFGAGKIRARIVDHVSRGEWITAIDETIGSVSGLLQALDSERHDLEKFIVSLTGELGAITRSIDADETDTENNQRDTEALNELVRDSVASIEHDVSAASDIDLVKAAISSNISDIRSGVDGFVGQLQQRYQASKARNRELSDRMSQMESETQALQRQLDDNRRQLMTDTLTGAYSRLAYDQDLAGAIELWRDSATPFAYAILDIDHFKRINDAYGHNAGDRALQLVVRLISDNLRQGDSVYRLGGEEFVLMMPATTAADADSLVDAVRGAINNCNFHFKKNQVTLTLSAGITDVREGDDLESIYQRADKSLYHAKETGRNRQIIAD